MSEKRDSRKNQPPGKAPSASGSPMDVELLARLVSLMTSHDLNTIELRDGSRRVTLKRGVPAGAVQVVQAPAMPTPLPAPTLLSSASLASSPSLTAEEAGYLRIISPMVGTFYVSPKPGEKPFVTVGAEVTEETDVCIIEAMKTFNNIKAECRGVIARVLVADGQPVEFGTVLFLVKPS